MPVLSASPRSVKTIAARRSMSLVGILIAQITCPSPSSASRIHTIPRHQDAPHHQQSPLALLELAQKYLAQAPSTVRLPFKHNLPTQLTVSFFSQQTTPEDVELQQLPPSPADAAAGAAATAQTMMAFAAQTGMANPLACSFVATHVCSLVPAISLRSTLT